MSAETTAAQAPGAPVVCSRAGCRAEARWLLPKICEAGNITRDAIGAIRVKTDQTFVQIAANVAANFGEGLERFAMSMSAPAFA